MIKLSDFNCKCLDFDFGAILGHGQFGTVFIGRVKYTDFKVAIKVINKTSAATKKQQLQMQHEVNIHAKLKHPNIVELYTVFQNEQHAFLVMELAINGTLHSYRLKQDMERLTEAETAKYVSQIASALHYCHQLEIIHRDIKPENILLDNNGNAKLSDFGWSVLCKMHLKEYCGTEEYIAPEMKARKCYNQCLDLWCLGVMCFELLAGTTPFHPKPKRFTKQNMITENRVIKYPRQIRPFAKEFIEKLLQREPSKRLSLTKVIKHPWVTSYYKE